MLFFELSSPVENEQICFHDAADCRCVHMFMVLETECARERVSVCRKRTDSSGFCSFFFCLKP